MQLSTAKKMRALRMGTCAKRLVPALLFVLALLMWGYSAHSRQLMEQRLTASGFPEGNISDLFPRWLGTRELLLNGRDPYSPEITQEIQRGYYGRPIDSRLATDPIDEQRFAYPLFVVFLLAPTISLPFTVVKPLFTLILSTSAVWTVLLWVRAVGLKAGRGKIFSCILLALATIPYAEGIQLQQLSVLVAFLLAAAVYALATEKFIVAGSLLAFQFQLPDSALKIEAHGQVAWANPNGQTGVHFLDISSDVSAELKKWLQAAAVHAGANANEAVPHCRLSDLSLGGCYVETDAPFPEQALVDLCLKTDKMEVHTEGMVRVAHPGHGMGVEFPSRTEEQRAQVGNLIDVLRSSPDTAPELTISPKALVADLTQFEPADKKAEESADDLEDPLLELLRRGTALQQEEFLSELHHQRNPQAAASV